MSALLPPAVTIELESLSQGLSRNDLSERSTAITDSYQKRLNSAKKLLHHEDALAYALARMPATYAATRRALLHLTDAVPEFSPSCLLDIGCGPGTASLAAHAVFPDIAAYTLIDRNGPFLDLAKRLATVGLPEGHVDIHDQDIAVATAFPKMDLVVASYVLAELSQSIQDKLLMQLWSATRQVLLLVEPGTPDGFERLKFARTALINAGGFIAAPCTHDAFCPMQTVDASKPQWCRFMERVQRSRDHRILKSADRPFEDEPYTYLAVIRTRPMARAAGRIVGRTSNSKIEIQIPLCTEHGLTTVHIPRRDKKKYKDYNKLEWGDAVVNLIQAAQEPDEK